MVTVSPDNRFEILYFTREDDSYFYSSSEENWHVRSIETGDELFQFSGSYMSDNRGTTNTGVERVHFDGECILEQYYNGSSKKHLLPKTIEIVKGGHELQLSFSDGTKKEIPRRYVIHTSKYGEPTIYPIKLDPAEKPQK